MLDSLKDFLNEFFGSVWSIFTNIPVPGTSLNFAQLWVGIFFSIFIINFIKGIIGIGSDSKKEFK